MGDGSLSQEEIDALLTGVDETPDVASGEVSTVAPPGQYPTVISALSEAMHAASSSMTALVGKDVKLTNPTSSIIDKNSIANQLQAQSVVVSAKMNDVGTLLSLDVQQAKKIAMNIMGATVEPTELDDAHLSSLNELCGTMISTIATYMGEKFSENLTPSTPKIKIFKNKADLPDIPSPNVMRANFEMSLEGISLGSFVIFIEESGPNRWAQVQSGGMNETMDGMNFDMGGGGGGDQTGDNLMEGFASDIGGDGGAGGQKMHPVSFPTFQTGGSAPTNVSPNYELLLDVQMVLTVELGRTTKYVKDILKLGEGSIIELDKLAGEPVDLLINGKLIAKGEVVVIDENFGVRVTDIVAPVERLAKISSS